MLIRLDKYLADMGVGTRSEVKSYIRKGFVLVDDLVVKKPEQKIDSDKQVVVCKGSRVAYEAFEYWMLNKPAGVVSATEDSRDRTVLDLIKGYGRKDLFPVGRLDKDTEGLLLLTNDGGLAHELLSPKKHVDKVYFARIDGVVSLEDVESFARGVVIDEEFTALPASLRILEVDREQGVSEIEVTIHEGKFHQVKRMFEAVGKKVVYLKRLSMGCLELDESLSLGEFRRLTDREIEALKAGSYNQPMQ